MKKSIIIKDLAIVWYDTKLLTRDCTDEPRGRADNACARALHYRQAIKGRVLRGVD